MSNNNNKFDVYLGKYRDQFGYGNFYVGGADTLDDIKKVLKKAQCKTGDDVFVYSKDHHGQYDVYVFDGKTGKNGSSKGSDCAIAVGRAINKAGCEVRR